MYCGMIEGPYNHWVPIMEASKLLDSIFAAGGGHNELLLFCKTLWIRELPCVHALDDTCYHVGYKSFLCRQQQAQGRVDDGGYEDTIVPVEISDIFSTANGDFRIDRMDQTGKCWAKSSYECHDGSPVGPIAVSIPTLRIIKCGDIKHLALDDEEVGA